MITSSLAFVITSIALASNPARDLREYDLLGPFSLDQLARHKEDRPIIEDAIRDFLWSRWQQHRLAHVAMVEYSTEGLPARTWYYVEPDKDGVWRIIIDDDTTLRALKPESQEHQREARSYEAYSLERIESLGRNSDKSNRQIPDNETRQPETYRLRLKRRDGHVIRVL